MPTSPTYNKSGQMKKAHRKLEGDLVVLPIDKNTVDVFVGNGWENWTRLQRDGSAFKILSGAGLNREQFQEFLKCV